MNCVRCGSIDSYAQQYYVDRNGNYFTEGQLVAFLDLHFDKGQVTEFNRVVLCGMCAFELELLDT